MIEGGPGANARTRVGASVNPKCDPIRHQPLEAHCRFVKHADIEIDTYAVERSVQLIVLKRNNSLHAGQRRHANWAIIPSFNETAPPLNDTLSIFVDGWLACRIDEASALCFLSGPKVGLAVGSVPRARIYTVFFGR